METSPVMVFGDSGGNDTGEDSRLSKHKKICREKKSKTFKNIKKALITKFKTRNHPKNTRLT